MHHLTTRRSLFRAGLTLATAAAFPSEIVRAAEPPHDVTYAEDFDELWRTLDERYCYFAEKQTDWSAARRMYRPLAVAAPSAAAFAEVVGRMIGELYDAHTHLSDAAADAPRGPYFDLWVEPNRDGTALITSVRDGSAAADMGIQPGENVVAIDGRLIGKVAEQFKPRCLARPDPAATAFALNIAVSGRRAQPRTLTLRSITGGEHVVAVPVKQPVKLPDVEGRVLPGGIGCIVIRSFADDAVVAAFDAELSHFRDAPGLIIDVRQNGGGDTAVARPIMGRFIKETKPYARMRRREESHLSTPWTETVDPRGPFTYTAPVAILTTRWSASMAEGFPMGMRGLGRATIIGTPMMRVGAAVFPLRLDRTGLELQYSAEPVYDVQDRPRWLLEPDVPVLMGGDILRAATEYLRLIVAKR
jgi:carboxyl-terminal processing protease